MAGGDGRARTGRHGAPVVIVIPRARRSRDVKPTPTGQVILDFLNRAMPAYLDTGLNWCTCATWPSAHPRGGKGPPRRTLHFGHAEGNWTMKQMFAVLAEIAGLPAPKF